MVYYVLCCGLLGGGGGCLVDWLRFGFWVWVLGLGLFSLDFHWLVGLVWLFVE